jgi:hypothetical protein
MTWFTASIADSGSKHLAGRNLIAAIVFILGSMRSVQIKSRTDSMNKIMVAFFVMRGLFLDFSWAPIYALPMEALEQRPLRKHKDTQTKSAEEMDEEGHSSNISIEHMIHRLAVESFVT